MELSVSTELLQKYSASSVVPVVERNFDEFLEQYRHMPIINRNFDKKDKPYGMAVVLSDKDAEEIGIPKFCAMIETRKSNLQKLYTIWHENGHFDCCIRQCECSENVVLSEIHADLFVFEMAKQEKMPQIIVFCMKEILRRRKYNSGPHKSAGNWIVLMPLWKEFIDQYGVDLKSYLQKVDPTLIETI